jgi:hypothetical protein
MQSFKKSALALAVTLVIPMFASAPAMAAISVNCNAGTLSGLYTYHINGFNIVGGVSVPTSSAGYSFYNADGTSQGRVTTLTQVKGKTVTTSGTFTATYKVTANCTVKEIDKDEHGALTHYDEFTTPTGNTIQFIETDQGVVSSGVATRD